MHRKETFTREELKEIIRTEIRQATREIIRAINARNADGLEIHGPRTAACREQVMAVVVWLANPRHPQNVHHACERTFSPLPRGYGNAHSLFMWCQRNESRLRAWVETYRLDHGIGCPGHI